MASELTRSCTRCRTGKLREAVETIEIRLRRSEVVARVAVPAGRCAACGAADVPPSVVTRAHLAAGCALADAGVHTGEALRHLRRALGLRAVDLARLLDLTPETISHWETGKIAPNRAAFVALGAMAHEALDGKTATRDRLAVLAMRRRWPRALSIRLR